MKKYLLLTALVISFLAQAQVAANRFFYELTYKPKIDSTKIQKMMTVLDIVPGKSVYQDAAVSINDSIMMSKAEDYKRNNDFAGLITEGSSLKSDFTYKVSKKYPTMATTYEDAISSAVFGYEEIIKFNWKITPIKEKIENYSTQIATIDFGGRKWKAWFSKDIPFPDGPYKFSGLPGLIVKIEDSEKNYSWVLKGNKTVEVLSEDLDPKAISTEYGSDTKTKIISREKFEKAYENFKADPMAEYRGLISGNEAMLNIKMPGSEETLGDTFKKLENQIIDNLHSNTNPIEISKKNR